MSRVTRRTAPHPIGRFRRWFGQARRAGLELPEAMALATADRRGAPSVRFVLMKEADERGIVFYTNAASRKGAELRANPQAAVVFYWHPLGKQVRFDGRIEPVAAADADAYWRTRPRPSQLAGAVSAQSAPLASRAALMKRYRDLERRLRGREVPRPPGWAGFRLVPRAVEFWIHRDHRLHERELFTRTRSGWTRTLLQP
jgi:pyridoxamine 5'-phosphate oxidase